MTKISYFTTTLSLSFLNFKNVQGGFVVGEDGQGQYTKGSEFMGSNRKQDGSVHFEQNSLPDLPELPSLDAFSDRSPDYGIDGRFVETESPDPTESSVDPNHQ